MYKCLKCKKIFYSPMIKQTTYESYYGVSGEFGKEHSLELYVCPYCEDDDILILKERKKN